MNAGKEGKAEERKLRDSVEEWCNCVQKVRGRVSRVSCIRARLPIRLGQGIRSPPPSSIVLILGRHNSVSPCGARGPHSSPQS